MPVSSLRCVLDRACLLLSVATLLAAAGCGSGRPTTIPVTGVVTLDGKPIAGASVMFEPEAGGRPATGTTDSSGKFTLKTFEAGDGALPGKHRISVSKSEMTGVQADKEGLSGPADPGGPKEINYIPKKYANPKTSGLTAEVASGMKPVELTLTSQ